ncbi:hypothetical protein POTOM_005207 [Populus tomentosa]|uniref:Uncharacterized protein n=1 Tax=Populus tomentosa TaxID=118781 RepID=A0A8X8AGL9_POPTO|nr:hypothetical protein POTOM_005207 [Populus tomentosa]
MFMISAQFHNPPDFFFENMCNAIDGAPEGTSILVRTAAGLNASIFGNQSCHYVYQFKKGKLAWPWQVFLKHSDNSCGEYGQYVFQTCTEIVMPMGTGGNDTMFQASGANRSFWYCSKAFGSQ